MLITEDTFSAAQRHALANSMFLPARPGVRHPSFPLPEHLQMAGPFLTETETPVWILINSSYLKKKKQKQPKLLSKFK